MEKRVEKKIKMNKEEKLRYTRATTSGLSTTGERIQPTVKKESRVRKRRCTTKFLMIGFYYNKTRGRGLSTV